MSGERGFDRPRAGPGSGTGDARRDLGRARPGIHPAPDDGFNQRDHHLIEEMLGDHLIDHSELLGRMDLRQRMYQVQRAFPDAKYQVIDYLVQGHAVAWRWSITGTHANEIMGIRPTGKRVTIPGLSVAVILNGKVVEYYEFADLQQVLAQIKDEPWS